ncbi:hypothetical protein Gotur_031188 [Gossypium turneri]
MDRISNHWILKNPNSIMKIYCSKLDHSLDSESEDESSASLIKTVNFTDDTTSVTITRRDSLQQNNA